MIRARILTGLALSKINELIADVDYVNLHATNNDEKEIKKILVFRNGLKSICKNILHVVPINFDFTEPTSIHGEHFKIKEMLSDFVKRLDDIYDDLLSIDLLERDLNFKFYKKVLCKVENLIHKYEES